MPTDAQIAASKGQHPVTEAFAQEIHVQAGDDFDGEPVPPGAWEHLPHETRERFRMRARDWIERGLASGLGMGDVRGRSPGGL